MPMIVPTPKNAAQVIVLVTRSRNMVSGMNGSRAVKSRAANSPHNMADPASKATISGELHR